MSKKITILAIDEKISVFFKKEINRIFNGIFDIDYRSADMKPVPSIENTDLVLFTDPDILDKLYDIIECNAPTLMMKRTITRQALDKLKKLPSEKKALVANINQYMANDTLALLYQLGINQLKLQPFYRGKKDFSEDIDYIIAPEKYDFLPDIDAETIVIGNRVFDISNIMDILTLLEVDRKKAEQIVKNYIFRVPTFWYGAKYNWDNRNKKPKKITGYFSKHNFSDLIGKNKKFLDTKKKAKKISSTNSTIILYGETGTGKELFAGAIHNDSQRKDNPFIAINCTTLPKNLLESELFGYEKGAFTGAKKEGKIGLFERADKGTLFLDEIGDLPLSLQARLLRVLEEKEIMRIGGDSIIPIDVRIIAASNKNLQKLVEKGEFRKDLYFRLNVFQFNIPPLRERIDDIPLLIKHFFDSWEINRDYNKNFMDFISNYDWPGNIRELKNVLKNMTTLSKNDLCLENLPDYLKEESNFNKNLKKNIVLKLIHDLESEKKDTGRRTLIKLFKQLYFYISEKDLRNILSSLNEKNYITIHRGRKGNTLTKKGKEFLNKKSCL
ncbi:MAG: sigma-54 interaction domain-containing protein [Bacillota bacterium]